MLQMIVTSASTRYTKKFEPPMAKFSPVPFARTESGMLVESYIKIENAILRSYDTVHGRPKTQTTKTKGKKRKGNHNASDFRLLFAHFARVTLSILCI